MWPYFSLFDNFDPLGLKISDVLLGRGAEVLVVVTSCIFKIDVGET